MAFYQNQLQAYSLAGAGAVAGATTVILKSMKDIDGNALTMATSFGTIGFGTIEPGNNTLEESISFTGLTNNSNGTTTLTGVKSVTFGQPYTQTSGLAKTHAGSTTFVVSNTSGYYTEFAIKSNDESVTGAWTFPNPPLANANPATKQYVDNLVSGGSVTNTAIVVTGTAGENVTVGQLLYLKVSDGFWYKASSAATGTIDLLQLGIAQSTTTLGNPITNGVLLKGIDTNQSGLAAGTIYYASTGGAIASSAGTVERAIGQGLSATSIYFDPVYYYIPTANQKAAFAGTSGTPSASNKFVTAAGLASAVKFGGTGADGALAITSGTTTISLGSAAVFIKNYTSISITGTGALAFSNPNANGTLIILKSQGDVTLTSSATPMIDARLMGAPGGAARSGNGNGNNGSNAISTIATCQAGTAGLQAGTNGTSGTGYNLFINLQSMVYSKQIPLWAGAGGGGGGVNTSAGTSGAGGRGGGGLYIECVGALNFTTASGISVAGQDGTNSDGSTNSGGGGGGAGGSAVILYGSLTAASGTIVATGGSTGSGGGSGCTGGAGAGPAGLNGLSLIAINSEFV